jgi:hypothetical protein
MGHYFDDVFHRNVGSSGHGGKPHMRRSSTARSIGARSDFEDDTHSLAGSVHHDEERSKERSEADAHLHSYVSDQLERYKDENKAGNYDHDDEFETKG